jgi:hypothetical protein
MRNKSKKNNFSGLQKATRINISDNPWDVFEEKDLYSTTEIISAIHVTLNLGMSIVISCPIPVQINEKLYLRFFLFTYKKVNDSTDKHLKSPYCKIQSPIDTYRKVEMTLAEPKDFNLNIKPDESMGNFSIVCRYRPFRGQLSSKEVRSWQSQLYSKMDEILQIYPCDPNTLNNQERETVSTYLELFISLIHPPYLPAYKSLNPHFFEWLEAVVGYAVDPLLGPENVAHEYHAVDGIPVKLVPAKEGGLEAFVMNMKTGQFERDMSYLTYFIDYHPDFHERIEHFTEEQFKVFTEQVRQTIRNSNV